MAERSVITNPSGGATAVRVVQEKDDGSHRVTTYAAHDNIFGGVSVGARVDDRTVEKDGTEYKHTGTFPYNLTEEVKK